MMKSALLGTSSLDQHLHLKIERVPVRVFLSEADMSSIPAKSDHPNWGEMKAYLMEKGVPVDRLESGANFKTEDTPEGVWLEFP